MAIRRAPSSPVEQNNDFGGELRNVYNHLDYSTISLNGGMPAKYFNVTPMVHADNLFFHNLILITDKRADYIICRHFFELCIIGCVEARTHLQANIMAHGQFNRARLKHFCPCSTGRRLHLWHWSVASSICRSAAARTKSPAKCQTFPVAAENTTAVRHSDVLCAPCVSQLVKRLPLTIINRSCSCP